MKKTLLTAALTLVAGSAMALQATGTVFSGTGCQGSSNNTVPAGTLNWCTGTFTSATTVAALGRINVNPARVQSVVMGVSGTGISGLVTPTLSFYLGNQVVKTLDVSVSSVGNVVNVNSVMGAGFSSLSVSTSLPGTISSTNAVRMSVIEK